MRIGGLDKLRDLLSRPDRGVGSTSGITGVLAGLFRQMLLDLNISGLRWSNLMDEYVRAEMQHSTENNRRDRTSIRGNLNKEFIRNKMTWKVFCRAMMLLKVRRFAIIIVAEHENGSKAAHSSIVDFSTAGVDPDQITPLKKAVEEIKLGNIAKYKHANDSGGVK